MTLIPILLIPLVIGFFFFVSLQDSKIHWSLRLLLSLTPFALMYFAGFYGLLFSAVIVASIFKASG